jgi:hypothetical protein
MPSLPIACDPRTEQGPLGFTPSFAPDWARPSHARQGRDRPRHRPVLRHRSQPTLLRRTHSTRATSRRTAHGNNAGPPRRLPAIRLTDGLTAPSRLGVSGQPPPIFTPAGRPPQEDTRTNWSATGSAAPRFRLRPNGHSAFAPPRGLLSCSMAAAGLLEGHRRGGALSGFFRAGLIRWPGRGVLGRAGNVTQRWIRALAGSCRPVRCRWRAG